MLILFIAGLLYLLCFEHVDNLGAYSIPSEPGLLIPSVIDSYSGIEGAGLRTLRYPVSDDMVQQLQISSYDPRWVHEFEDERRRIAQALGELACRIDHNGSTAVPGIEAKPIIDIQVSVAKLQPICAYGKPLATLGYVHMPHVDDAFCPFFHRPRGWPHTHHVHVVQSGGHEERRTLAFRDFLREHGDVAREYASLKKRLATLVNAAESLSRETYANAKGEFINRVVQIALAAGYPRWL